MTRQDMLRKFEEFVKAEPNSISDDTLIDDIGEWDSLKNVEFRMLVEDEFGQDLDGVKVDKARKVGDLMDLVAELGFFEA